MLMKGTDGLAALVPGELLSYPFIVAIIVFRAKRADRLKLLFWDGAGWCLYAMRFRWPRIRDSVIRLQFFATGALRKGLDEQRVHQASASIAGVGRWVLTCGRMTPTARRGRVKGGRTSDSCRWEPRRTPFQTRRRRSRCSYSLLSSLTSPQDSKSLPLGFLACLRSGNRQIAHEMPPPLDGVAQTLGGVA